MGNHTSACFSLGSQKTAVKLIDAQGNHQLLNPITILTAVELMLENPGYAVTSLDNLIQTHRISAMRADESLSAGKTYLLVPLGKVNSRITDAQMAALNRTLSAFCRKSSLKKKRESHSGGSRVSPTSSMDKEEIVASEKKLDELWLSTKNDMSDGGLPIRGRWSPSLNPIVEE